ncbi:MAG: response regulator transcription factor [Dehalococcoidales bacterium]|nr:response regulator transcription factor [Dehalococcoidales bacterium]
MDKIKVLLLDDHPVVREGLNVMLVTAPDIEVVAEAGDGFEAVDKANKHQPDVVLMDLRMPNLDGLEATRRIKKQLPSTVVIVLTVYDNDAYVMDAVKAGAGGYLLKDASKDLLINTIRAVNSGGMLVKTSLLREAFRDLPETSDIQPLEKATSIMTPSELTSREHDVLQLLTQGRSNKEIGRALCISEDTAKKHVQTIMLKLRVSDRTQAAVKAVRNGLVTNFPDKEI